MWLRIQGSAQRARPHRLGLRLVSAMTGLIKQIGPTIPSGLTTAAILATSAQGSVRSELPGGRGTRTLCRLFDRGTIKAGVIHDVATFEASSVPRGVGKPTVRHGNPPSRAALNLTSDRTDRVPVRHRAHPLEWPGARHRGVGVARQPPDVFARRIAAIRSSRPGRPARWQGSRLRALDLSRRGAQGGHELIEVAAERRRLAAGWWVLTVGHGDGLA